MTTATTSSRREVHYASLDEFLHDAQRLAEGEARTLGEWTYAQILQHLSVALTASVVGFGFRGPWLLRTLIGPMVLRRILKNGMKPGFRLKGAAQRLIPSDDVALPKALSKLRTAVERFQESSTLAEHPVFGRLDRDQWTALHLRHAELHMSFVHPAE